MAARVTPVWRADTATRTIKAMTNFGEPLGPDAHYLDATARLFGWQVAWEQNGSARISQPDWTMQAFFDHDGAFQSSRATGPNTGNLHLTLPEAIDTLERYGTPVPPGH